MNFSLWQWRAIFVLDVFIKASLIYLSAVLVSLGLIIVSGFEPVVPFVLIGISISGLHFLCLHFANLFVVWLGLKRPGLTKILLVLTSANILFATILTIVLSITGDIFNNALLSMMVAATNLIPILLVAPIAWILGRIIRPR